MKVRDLVAAGVIGMVSLVGTAGIAAAQTTPNSPTPTAHNKQALCAKATARLLKIQDRIAKIEQRIATLKTRLAGAQAQNQDDRAQLIQQRIDWAQTVHDHLGAIVTQINTRCGT